MNFSKEAFPKIRKFHVIKYRSKVTSWVSWVLEILGRDTSKDGDVAVEHLHF